MHQISLYIHNKDKSSKVQISVSNEAYKVYVDAGYNKSGLVESLLIDAYNQNNMNVVFSSKRGSNVDKQKVIVNNPIAIYKDAGRCKSALIDQLLIQAKNDSRYFLFLISKRSQVIDKEVEKISDTKITDHTISKPPGDVAMSFSWD